MGGDCFRFQQFSVRQQHSAMKVGTDGMILGSWAEGTLPKGDLMSILDVGTGTGLIALMVAQRYERALVDAVEIDSAAAGEAADNFRNSPFGDRLSVECIDFQSFAQSSTKTYDLIVSNPPFFNGTYKSTDAKRTAARHKELLPSDDLLDGVLGLLSKEGGRFVAIFPSDDAALFISKATNRGLYCRRKLDVYPREGKSIKRVVAEFSFERVEHPITEQLVVMDANNCYTESYKSLTAAFYEHF